MILSTLLVEKDMTVKLENQNNLTWKRYGFLIAFSHSDFMKMHYMSMFQNCLQTW
jgi:hypothetical protein